VGATGVGASWLGIADEVMSVTLLNCKIDSVSFTVGAVTASASAVGSFGIAVLAGAVSGKIGDEESSADGCCVVPEAALEGITAGLAEASPAAYVEVMISEGFAWTPLLMSFPLEPAALTCCRSGAVSAKRGF
jgi:hypothetical protein